MSADEVIEVLYRNDWLVQAVDPEDESVPLSSSGRLLTAAGGATSTFRVLSVLVRSPTTALMVAPWDVQPVEISGVFTPGDRIRIIQGAGAVEALRAVASVDVDASTITLDSPLSDVLRPEVGTVIEKIYGVNSEEIKLMSQYGTPKVGDDTWGFASAFKNQDFVKITPGKEFEIEIAFNGGVATLDWIETTRYKMVQRLS